MSTTSTNAFDVLVQSLDEKDMKNKELYQRTILLSQRIQQKLSLLQKNRCDLNKYAINTKFDSNDKHPSSSEDMFSQQSPTKTIIAYNDDSRSSISTCSYYPLYNQEESQLPQMVHMSCSKSTSTVGSRHSSLATIVVPNVNNNTSKSLPSIPIQNNLYKHSCFDSTVELSSLQAPLPPLPPIPSLPSTKHTSRPLAIIQNASKKYCGIRNLLSRTYQLENIIVTRTLISPYLYAGEDKYTFKKKAVLKLILVQMADGQITFAFPQQSPRAPPPARLQPDVDSIIQQQLATWISHQPLLPLLVHAQHIYRVGIKFYIVYNVQ